MIGNRNLGDKLEAQCSRLPFHAAYWIQSCRKKASFARLGDAVVPSASTRKIAILMAAYKAVHEGRLNLDDPFVLQEKNRHHTSGCFQFLTPGIQITLRDAMVMMIIVSDNTCTGGILELLGLEAVNEYCARLGLPNTRQTRAIPEVGKPGFPPPIVNTTTPEEIGRLLDMILAGSMDEDAARRLGCARAQCADAVEVLSQQRLRNRIPARLPQNLKIAHKTGAEEGAIHDAGIVFHEGRPLFIISAFCARVPWEMPDGSTGYSAAVDLIASWSRICFDYFKGDAA